MNKKILNYMYSKEKLCLDFILIPNDFMKLFPKSETLPDPKHFG